MSFFWYCDLHCNIYKKKIGVHHFFFCKIDKILEKKPLGAAASGCSALPLSTFCAEPNPMALPSGLRVWGLQYLLGRGLLASWSWAWLKPWARETPNRLWYGQELEAQGRERWPGGTGFIEAKHWVQRQRLARGSDRSAPPSSCWKSQNDRPETTATAVGS